jgi:hypothetical protein
MPNKVVVTVDASKMTHELLELVRRAYRDKPDQKDLRELRRKLEEVPELWKGVFDIVEVIKSNLIDKAIASKAARLALESNISNLMRGMGYENASVLEKLLIENIIITWLRLQWVEYQMVVFMGDGEVRMSVVEFWERRLSMAQRRHLRACETLARVRKLLMNGPVLQVNIATKSGQQVNVAGDLTK